MFVAPIDESILTGESISVNKNINDNLYSGTYIVGVFIIDLYTVLNIFRH